MLDRHFMPRENFSDKRCAMELRVLRYFLAVAREGSVTGAANLLHVTQPTLSRQLMDLEGELGRRLFERGSHSVRLTGDGILLKRRAEEILDMAERTLSEFSGRDGSGAAGDVYIGGGETCAMGRIGEMVRGLRLGYPRIRFNLYSGNADDVTEKLDRGLLDFGLLIHPADLSKYDYVNLPDRDVWGVLMRADNPLAEKRRIRKRDLLGIPVFVSRQVSRRAYPKNDLLEWLGGDLEGLDIAGTYNLIYNAGIMVREGVGCAIVLDKLADTGEGSGLCFRPLMPKVEAGLSVVWKKGRYFSEAAKVFLAELKSRFGK